MTGNMLPYTEVSLPRRVQHLYIRGMLGGEVAAADARLCAQRESDACYYSRVVYREAIAVIVNAIANR